MAIHCGSCKTEKSDDAFSFRKKAKGVRHTTCKECQKSFKRSHYEKNLSLYKSRSALSKKESIERNVSAIIEYLKEHPCVDCGEPDEVVLEFDHRERDLKISTVSKMAFNGCSLKKIFAEIDKCDVRCANCHRRRTANQFGWKRMPSL